MNPAYLCWKMMRNRCTNPNDPKFKNHGGRGITVCDEWMNSFETFSSDMGERPSNYSIDRIDNNKGYFKENCKWSSMTEQNNNKTNNVLLTHNGMTMTVSQWAVYLNMNVHTLFWRIKRKWSIEKTLSNNNIYDNI